MTSKKKEVRQQKTIAESRIGFYFRVSTDAQREQLTIEIQKDDANTFIKSNNLSPSQYEFFIDDGLSAADEDFTKRPAFTRLYQAILEKKIDMIWVYDLSRFSRNPQVSTLFASTMKKKNVLLYERGKVWDINNPNDALFFSIKSAFDDFEHSQILMRTSAGRRKQIDNGLYTKPRLFGYVNRHVDKSKTTIPIPVEDKLELMKKLLEMFIAGSSYSDLKRFAGYGKITGWHSKLVHPEYSGQTYNSNGELIPSKLYKPIITPEQFQLILKREEEIRSDYYKHVSKDIRHYSGLIRCGECNKRNYVFFHFKDWNYYNHADLHHKDMKICDSNSTLVSFEVANTLIDNTYKLYFLLKDMAINELGIIIDELNTKKSQNKDELDTLTKQIADKKEQLKKTRKEMTKSTDFDRYDDFAEIENELKKELVELMDKQKKIQLQSNDDIEKYIEQNKIINNYTISLFDGIEDLIEKREKISNLFSSMFMYRDNVLVISTYTNFHFIYSTKGKKGKTRKEWEIVRRNSDISRLIRHSIKYNSTIVLKQVVKSVRNVGDDIKKYINTDVGENHYIFDFRGFEYDKKYDWVDYIKNNGTKPIDLKEEEKKLLKKTAKKEAKERFEDNSIDTRFKLTVFNKKSKKEEKPQFHSVEDVLFPNGRK